MEKKELNSLEELENEVSTLRELIKANKVYEHQVLAKTLFRGHTDAAWDLKTTLERYSSETFSVKSYNEILWAINPAISSFTGKDWPFARDFVNEEDFFSRPPNYEFMAYVRHHGFPSPLLDWTQSLYIALFFAYQNAKKAKCVAIFVYIDFLRSVKTGWVGSSQIHLLGPYVKTHQRHFAQQGQYTISVKKEEEKWVYCPHEEAFNESRSPRQDLLFKFTLPGDLKDKIMSKLYEMNINAFTLFSSEESLMATEAYKEIILRNL